MASYDGLFSVALDADGWNALHGDLMVMEQSALETMREFAPKPDK